MKVFATVDASTYNRAMRGLRVLIGDNMWEPIIKEEAIQLIKGAVRLDNAMTLSGAGKLGTTARAVRERIVAYEIKRTQSALDPSSLTHTRFREAILALVAKGDREYAQEFFDRIKVGRFRGTILTSFSRAYHRDNIDQSTGRARRTKFRLLRPMDWIQLNTYVKETQGHVGWKFGGFNTAAANLGFTLPQWVARHTSAPGSFSAELGRTGRARAVEIRNAAFKNPAAFGEHLDKVMALRVRAMATKVKRIIEGEAVNLGFATIEKGGRMTMRDAENALTRARKQEIEG